MSTKRVILANNSRLVREMLHQVISKTDNLEVVLITPNQEELPSAIERFEPEWIITSLPSDIHKKNWVDACMERYPAVRFILLAANHDNVKMKWQTFYEEDLTNLSLKDFIQILKREAG